MNLLCRVVIVLTLPAAPLIHSAARAQALTTERASVSSGGVEGNGDSYNATLSSDGRFVAFWSSASNLVAGDTNQSYDVFVRDRLSGTTERVSVSTVGTQGNAHSENGLISADGRFVAFFSSASNLVAGDTNGKQDVFLRDRQNGTTELVSVDSSGAQGNADSYADSISNDGRFVAFEGVSSNFVAGGSNGSWHIFVRDRTNGTTQCVSVNSSGAQSAGVSMNAALSSDGRFVAFMSTAANLVVNDTNGFRDVFVRDRQSGTTERVSIDSASAQANGDSWFPSISADGRFVAFQSYGSNIVVGDTNAAPDIFVRDRQNGTTVLVSKSTSGAQGDAFSDYPSLSSDGHLLAFESYATNLVALDTNAAPDVFVRDLLSGTTERVSVAVGGAQGFGDSDSPSISADGRCVAFYSYAVNLVASDTNGRADVFLRELGGPPKSYCTSSTSSYGCSATIAASANPSVLLANACTITVTNVEGLKSGILFYGVNNSGFVPGPWATGSTSLLCVKPPTQRTPIQNSGGTFNACDGAYVLDWNAYQTSNPLALGNPWSVGDRVFAQAWFRDPLAVKSTDLSNAVEMTYVP